jgi:hypothetical protein
MLTIFKNLLELFRCKNDESVKWKNGFSELGLYWAKRDGESDDEAQLINITDVNSDTIISVYYKSDFFYGPFKPPKIKE